MHCKCKIVSCSSSSKQLLQKSFARFPRPIRLVYVHIIQCPVITPITVLTLLVWSLSRVNVHLLSSLRQIFHGVLPLSETAHLLLIRSTIALSIISLRVPRGIPNVENLSESSMVVHLLVKSSALQFPGISLCRGTYVMQTSYRFAISLRHLRQSYNVLEFITLESFALMDTWLSESIAIFRL